MVSGSEGLNLRSEGAGGKRGGGGDEVEMESPQNQVAVALGGGSSETKNAVIEFLPTSSLCAQGCGVGRSRWSGHANNVSRGGLSGWRVGGESRPDTLLRLCQPQPVPFLCVLVSPARPSRNRKPPDTYAILKMLSSSCELRHPASHPHTVYWSYLPTNALHRLLPSSNTDSTIPRIV